MPFLTSGHTTDLDRLAFHSGKAVLLCRIRTPFVSQSNCTHVPVNANGIVIGGGCGGALP